MAKKQAASETAAKKPEAESTAKKPAEEAKAKEPAVSQNDKEIAELVRKAGYPYTADYIEMFGQKQMNPWFTRGANEKTELFYKRCVEEQHPWDYYVDGPDGSVIL